MKVLQGLVGQDVVAIAHNSEATVSDCRLALPVGKAHPFPRAGEHENKSSRESENGSKGLG
jgi:hypothetical protein